MDNQPQHSSTASVPSLPIDVTQLHALLQLHQEILDALPMIIATYEIISRTEFRMVVVDRNALEMSGFSRADVIGKRNEDILPPEEAAHAATRFQRCLDTGTVVEVEDAYTLPNGTIWLQAVYLPIRNAAGRITHIVTMTHDITARKLREIAEQQAQQEIIAQQSAALAELSTPLLTISDKTVVMPLVGAVDSGRIQQIMETLLSGVATSQASMVIVDITGVSIVDTQVASALLQAAQAVGLLGAQVILTGIRPEVAQTLVGLGVDLRSIITRGTLQDGIAYAQG